MPWRTSPYKLLMIPVLLVADSSKVSPLSGPYLMVHPASLLPDEADPEICANRSRHIRAVLQVHRKREYAVLWVTHDPWPSVPLRAYHPAGRWTDGKRYPS